MEINCCKKLKLQSFFHGKSKTTEIWFSKSTVYIWVSLKFLFWNGYFSKFVRNIGGAEWVGGIFGPKIFWFVLGGGAFCSISPLLPHHLSKQPFSSKCIHRNISCLLIKLQICKFLLCNLANFSQRVANQWF